MNAALIFTLFLTQSQLQKICNAWVSHINFLWCFHWEIWVVRVMNLTDRNVFCYSKAWKKSPDCDFYTTIFPVYATKKLQNCNFTWCVAIFFCTWKITKSIESRSRQNSMANLLAGPTVQSRAGRFRPHGPVQFEQRCVKCVMSLYWKLKWLCA